MDTFTVRVEESLRENIGSEYEDYGFEGRSDYIRHILENRHVIMDGAPTEHELSDRVDELESEIRLVKGAIAGLPTLDGDADPVAVFGSGEVVEEEREPPVASVDELDIRGRGDVLEARRDALQAVYERLQLLGEATKRELLEPVDAEAVSYKDVDSFWSNVIGGRDTLSRLPGVEPPVSGGRTWRYQGE